MAKKGVFLDNFGVIWAQFGIVSDFVGNTFTPKNSIINTENAKSAKFPRLIRSQTPAPTAHCLLPTEQTSNRA